jgi:hypothetical protein
MSPAQQRRFLEALGMIEPEWSTGPPDFDGGARPVPRKPQGWPPGVRPLDGWGRELGWGAGIEIEDGAWMFFGELGR